jgi:photosystem II stability/assembly factor-like uncharacterized protein
MRKLMTESKLVQIVLSLLLACLGLWASHALLNAQTNQAQLWVNMGIYGGGISDAVVDPTTGRVYLVLGGCPAFYRSDDNGEHWVSSNAKYAAAQQILLASDGALYANFDPGLMRSTDGGDTWTLVVNASNAPYAYTIYGFDIDANNANHIVVGTGGGASGDGFAYVTTNGGASWVDSVISVAESGRVEGVAIDPTDVNGDIVYAVSGESWFDANAPSHIHRSLDGGYHFTKIFTAPVGEQMSAVAVSPAGTIFAGSSQSLYRSEDGLSWVRVLTNTGRYVNFIDFGLNDPNIIYVDGYVSHNGGDSWTPLSINGFVAQSPANPDMLFTQSGVGIKRSIDSGTSWDEVNYGIEGVLVWDALSDRADNQIIYVATGSGFGRSMDGGQSWEFPMGNFTGDYRALATDPNETGVVYLDGGVNFYRSLDYGQTWEQSYVDPPSDSSISDIAVDPNNGDLIYVAMARYDSSIAQAVGGLSRSLDGGQTWINTTLAGLPVNAVETVKTPSGTAVFAGVGDYWLATVVGGVYRSLDNGDAWNQVGLANKVVSSLAIHPTDPNVIFAGTVKENFPSGAERPVYRSLDGGDTWEKLSLLNCGNVEAIAIDPNAPNIVIVSSCSQLHKSFDGGATWFLYYEGRPGDQFQAVYIPFLPPSPVSNFTAQPYTGSVHLAWTYPGDPDLVGAKINYLTDTFPTAHHMGVTLTDQMGMPGGTDVFTHTGTLSDTTYYYAAFAYDLDGRFSNPTWVSATVPVSGGQVFSIASVYSADTVSNPGNRLPVYLAASSGLYRRLEAGGLYDIYLPLVIKKR